MTWLSCLQKLGLNIIVDVIPASSLKDLKANGQLAFFRASWVADYPDAENYLSLYYSENFAPNGPNYTHFKNWHHLLRERVRWEIMGN